MSTGSTHDLCVERDSLISEARRRNIAVFARAEGGTLRCDVLDDRKVLSQVEDTERDFRLKICAAI